MPPQEAHPFHVLSGSQVAQTEKAKPTNAHHADDWLAIQKVQAAHPGRTGISKFLFL